MGLSRSYVSKPSNAYLQVVSPAFRMITLGYFIFCDSPSKHSRLKIAKF